MSVCLCVREHVCVEYVSVSPQFFLGIVKQHLYCMVLIEHVSKANADLFLLGC